MLELAEFAQQVARDAGGLLRRYWDQPRRVYTKEHAVDLVTDCDRAAEGLIVDAIRRAYPDHAVLAEESAAAAGAAIGDPAEPEYCWIIDPLDGTTNWVHSCPHFSVSVAVAHRGIVSAGAVYDPLRDEMFHAQRHGGAWRNEHRISTSPTATLDEALLATGFPHDRREHPDFYVDLFRDFIRTARDIRRFGSAALDLCYVASGRFDGFWEWSLRPWDIAAGALIVEEAGGTVTDHSGNPVRLLRGQTLASNGHIHSQMIDILRRAA